MVIGQVVTMAETKSPYYMYLALSVIEILSVFSIFAHVSYYGNSLRLIHILKKSFTYRNKYYMGNKSIV